MAINSYCVHVLQKTHEQYAAVFRLVDSCPKQCCPVVPNSTDLQVAVTWQDVLQCASEDREEEIVEK